MLTYHWVDFRKCPKSSVCTYHNMDFRKNAKHLMCDLTTKWILESAQSLACALIYWYDVLWLGSATPPLEWEGPQMLRRELHARRWPSTVRGAMLARSTSFRAIYTFRTLESGELQMLRRERHAHRWPSRWGEQMLAQPARWVTYHRALRSGEWRNSYLRTRGSSDASEGSTYS